jgi:hypothetical protein
VQAEKAAIAVYNAAMIQGNRNPSPAIRIAITALAVILLCAAKPGEAPRESLPPKQWDKSMRELFPPNPKSRLRGERPALRGTNQSPDRGAPDNPMSTDPGAFAWSKIISAETATNEIKSYRAEGHRQARRQFSVLAAMFGIIAEYDQTIRWKQNSAAARAAFARAAVNAKAADDNTFNESKARSQNLDDLVQGGSAEFPAASAGEVKWPEGYDSADDAEYQKQVKELRQGALAAAAAVRDNNLGAAQKAIGIMSKACTECHGAFK